MKSGLLKFGCLAVLLGICFWGKSVLEPNGAKVLISTDDHRLYEDARFYGFDFETNLSRGDDLTAQFDDAVFWGVPSFEEIKSKEQIACY